MVRDTGKSTDNRCGGGTHNKWLLRSQKVTKDIPIGKWANDRQFKGK